MISGDLMNKKLLFAVAAITILACCAFVMYNPTISEKYDSTFSEGEVFTPQNGHFDFKNFSLDSSKIKNFTAKIISNGHTQFVDDTGNITINYLELDKMIHIKRDEANSFLADEMKNPSKTVDGVTVYEIDYNNTKLYSAYKNDSSKNTVIYLSTTSDKETAELMNSIK